jgi:hypothetical protein
MAIKRNGAVILDDTGKVDWSKISPSFPTITTLTTSVDGACSAGSATPSTLTLSANTLVGTARSFTLQLRGGSIANCPYNCQCQCQCACNCDCSQCGSSCFLAGSPVVMADGSFKAIEDIDVGEFVQGRFGEANRVLALDRPTLGGRSIWCLNGEHWTTDEHTHFTHAGPAAIDLDAHAADAGRWEGVIVEGGKTEVWQRVGFTRTPVKKLQVGDDMVVRHNAHRRLETLERLKYPAGTPLYNLVLGGSHTCYVDGYLVTGWLRDDDFDYAAWQVR